MTREDAIKVLLDEWKCIDRNDGINCDRQCEKCDLVMDSAILKDAYNMAIKALSQEPKLTGICNECLKKNGCEMYSQLIKSGEKYTVESCEKYIAKLCVLDRRVDANTVVFRTIDGKEVEYIRKEPCDDAIDREYLFKVLDDFCGHDRTATITLDTLADLVYDMPTVTQKPIEFEDAISREAVLKKQYRIDDSATLSTRDVVDVDDIEDLPPIRPQLCDDAISRDAVFNAIEHEDKWLLAAKGHNGLTEIAFSGLKARVDALPSVNPQSCDDAISREDAIKAVYGMTRYTGIDEAPYEYAEHVIAELPSVTQKSGKWLMTGEVDVYYDLPSYECSICGKTSLENGDYCPNCGAKMESEE